MTDDLAPLTTRLVEPSPPPAFSVAVMARIARESDRPSIGPAEAPAPAPRRRDGPAWLPLLAGLSCVLGVTLSSWVTGSVLPDLTAPRIGGTAADLFPGQGPAPVLLGFGLLVYLVGLLAPLRRSDR